MKKDLIWSFFHLDDTWDMVPFVYISIVFIHQVGIIRRYLNNNWSSYWPKNAKQQIFQISHMKPADVPEISMSHFSIYLRR